MDDGQGLATDADLVRRARHGEAAAFHTLVDRHSAYLFGLARAMISNLADAEDLVQETLAGAYRGLAGYREQASVKTWLTQILVRQAAGQIRRRRRWWFLPLERLKEEPSCPSSDDGVDARLDVRAAVLALPAEYRDVIVLREFQGLSYDRIARELGIPRGTVESRLFRARRQLEQRLKDYLPRPSAPRVPEA